MAGMLTDGSGPLRVPPLSGDGNSVLAARARESSRRLWIFTRATSLRVRARETLPDHQPAEAAPFQDDSRVAIRCQTGCAAQAVDPLRSCLERVVADRPRRAR